MFPGPGDPKALGRYLALGQVGMEMVVPIVLGLWLDSALGWAPWCAVAGVVIGFVGGLAHLITMAQAHQAPTKRTRTTTEDQKPDGEATP